jgi:hypothetical protein
VQLPVIPHNDVFEKMTNKQMKLFKARIETLKEAIETAREEVDPVKACEALNKVFEDDFPIPEKDDTGEKRAPALIASSHSG